MPKLEPILRVELDPRAPVPELCAVIDGVVSYHPTQLEPEILRGLRKAIDERLEAIEKEAEKRGEQVLQPGRE